MRPPLLGPDDETTQSRRGTQHHWNTVATPKKKGVYKKVGLQCDTCHITHDHADCRCTPSTEQKGHFLLPVCERAYNCAAGRMVQWLHARMAVRCVYLLSFLCTHASGACKHIRAMYPCAELPLPRQRTPPHTSPFFDACNQGLGRIEQQVLNQQQSCSFNRLWSLSQPKGRAATCR